MISSAELQLWQISPTDLTYLFEDCKRCFYDKIRNGLELPRAFSPHFTNADRAMRRAIGELDLVDFGVGPRFRVITQGEWVQSAAVPFLDLGISLSFRGQIDALIFTEDSEVFIVDYKTTTLDDLALIKFRPQLSAYATCLEQPLRQNSTLPKHVDGMAILVFDPSTFVFRRETKRGGLYGNTRWVELPRRNERFDALLNEVAMLLSDDVAPEVSPSCAICRLRFSIRSIAQATPSARQQLSDDRGSARRNQPVIY